MADKEFNVLISAEADDFTKGVNNAECEARKFGDTLDNDISNGAESAIKSLEEVIKELKKLKQDVIGITHSVNNLKDSLNNANTSFDNTSNIYNKFSKEMKNLSMLLGEDLSNSTKQAYSDLHNLHEEYRKASRYYGSYSKEALDAKDAITKFALSLDDTTFKQIYMRNQLGLTDAQLRQQANSIKLNARMTKLMGNQTEILTKRMEGLAKCGIKPEMLLPPSTIGNFQLLNETVNASGRGIYNLSYMYRKLGGSVEKVIKNYSAQKVAIRQAQGDMVKYGLILRGITAANTNMAIAFPIVGMFAYSAYKTMFKAAMEADKSLKKLAETTKGKVLKALEPVTKAAGSFLKVALNIVSVVSDWIIKFNEAHPIISKIVGAIGFLLPIMTLLLLPLQMGIGLWNGWMVAINGVWTLLGGVVSMIGLASSTFLAIASIIGVVSGAIMHLLKTNENFRKGVTKAWDFLKQKASDVFGTIAKYFTETLPKAYKECGIEGIFNTIYTTIQSALTNITKLLPQWIQKGFEIINNLLLGIGKALPSVYAKSTTIVTTLVNGIIKLMPIFINTASILLKSWLNAITTNLPIILNGGIKILQTLIDGIVQTLPTLIDVAIQLLTTFVDIISTNLPTILNAGITVLTTLVDGICNSLPMVIDAVTQILDTFVNFIIDNLPMIIDVGINIITTLSNAIINNLPKIIDSTLQIMLTIVKAITNNLPKIIESAGKIITSLVSGLIKGIPKILKSGIDLIVALCKGIIQSIPNVTKAITDVIKGGIDTVKNKISDWTNIGKDMIQGLINGIKGAAKSVVKAVSGVVGCAISSAKKLLGINSPSKLFRQFGEWTTEGYEIGINRGEPSVTRSVKDFAQNSINTFTDNTDKIGRAHV